MKKILYAIKCFFLEKIQKMNDSLDAILSSPQQKTGIMLLVVCLELLAAYLIAVLDLLFIGTPQVALDRIIAEYLERNRWYPIWLFLLATVAIFIGTYIAILNLGAGNTGRKFSLSGSQVYGSGREITKAEIREVAEITPKNAAMGTILGQLDKTEQRVVSTKDGGMPNNNQIVFGSPGSGKTFGYVLPYIAQAIRRGESICTSDTKGEIYASTVELARKHGYTVYRLDLKNPAFSDGWDVLKELRNDDMRALIFAQIVMSNTGSDKDIHASAEESLLKACCLFKERMPNQPEEERTFYNAFKLLLQGADNLDAQFKGASSAYPEEMRVAMDSYATFLQGSANLRGNVISGLSNRLQVLASPPVREMTSTPDIDFTTLGKKKTIIYISMSDQHSTMKFLASLAFSFAFLDLIDYADSRTDQKLPIPVNFMMEEFGNIGKIPNIDRYLSTARSRGISINLVVQSLGQLKELYEENLTNVILADCSTWLCIGCNDKDTADLLEWRSGEATVAVKTEQHDALEPLVKFGYRHSTGDGRRNFYTSNDIMKMEKRKVLIIWQRKDTLMCHSFGINRHTEFIEGRMPVINSNSTVPLSDKKARQFLRDQEKARIEAYNEWIALGGNPWKSYSAPVHENTGPATGTDIPDIIPLPILEKMALAHSRGEQYDPTKDPENPAYKEPAQEIKSNPTAPVVASEGIPQQQPADEILDLGDLVFFRDTEAEKPPIDPPQNTAPVTQELPAATKPETPNKEAPAQDMPQQQEAPIDYFANHKGPVTVEEFFGPPGSSGLTRKKDKKPNAFGVKAKGVLPSKDPDPYGTEPPTFEKS